jgi:hypothetical protein
MLPARYLYLVDIETNQPLAIFSLEEFDREGEVILYEAQLRAQHNVDDAESGLALRDSLLDPLPEGTHAPVHQASATVPPPRTT